jgi:hypothetical protein
MWYEVKGMKKMTVILLAVIVCLGTAAVIDSINISTIHEHTYSEDQAWTEPPCVEEPIPTPPPSPCDGGGAGGGGGGAPG